MALAQLHTGDHPVPLPTFGLSKAAALPSTRAEQPLRPCERDQRIADLMSVLNVKCTPPRPALLVSDSIHSPTLSSKPTRATQQPCSPSLESPAVSALSQATTAESGRYRCTGGAAHNGAAAGGQRRAANDSEGVYVNRSARAAGDCSVPAVGEGCGGRDERGHRPRLGRPFAGLGDDGEVEEDLEFDAEEQSYGDLEESVLDETEPVTEEDPFDVAADAVLAAARSRHVRGSGPHKSQPQSSAPAPSTAATAPQNAFLDLDATMCGTFKADTSLDLFRYAEKQATRQHASMSAVCQQIARADDSLRARRAAESSAAGPAASASPVVVLPASVQREPAPAHRAPRALPPRPPKPELALGPSVAAPVAAPTPAAKPTSARLAAGGMEVRRAASDAGPNLPRGRLGGDAPRPRQMLARPRDMFAAPGSRPDGAPPGARRDVDIGALFGAEQRPVAGGERAASRQREQEELMQERKLEASLDRLDTRLAQYRARRNACTDSDTASCLSAVSRAHSTVSAPARAQSAAAVVYRLRSGTREAARQQGWYGDEPPCKRHGLLSCKLCAEEALRPLIHKPAIKAAVVLPPPPPPRRVRSAHPPNRTQVCSYMSARQLGGGASLCAGQGQGTVARALQAARAECRPLKCPPHAPPPADLPPGIPAWLAAPLPYGVHPPPQATPLTAEQLDAYAGVPVPTGAMGWPPLGPHSGAQMLMAYQPAYAHCLNGPSFGLGPAELAPLPPFPSFITSHPSEGKGPSSRAQAQEAAGPGGTIVVNAPNSQSLLSGEEYGE